MSVAAMQYHDCTRDEIYSVASEIAVRQTLRAAIPGLGSSRQFVRGRRRKSVRK